MASQAALETLGAFARHLLLQDNCYNFLYWSGYGYTQADDHKYWSYALEWFSTAKNRSGQVALVDI